MHFIEPEDRHQLSLMNNMDSWIDKDNIVRLIDVMVDQIIKHQPEVFLNRGQQIRGRKAYNPSTLQKLYLYGYLNGIDSSRKLERECHRNLEMMWLLGNLRPDHKTIADYRRDNSESIHQTGLSFRKFLRDEKFIDGKTVAYDGTKIKANASRDLVNRPNVDKQIKRLETELDKYLSRLQSNDIVDDLEDQLSALSGEYDIEPALLEKIADLQKQLEKMKAHQKFLENNDLKSYSPADPEARLMKNRDGFLPSYNVQTGVDKKNKMIVTAKVTDSINDLDQLPDNVELTKSEMGFAPETVEADKGYGETDGIKKIEDENPDTECVVPLKSTKQNNKDKKAGISFTYNEKEDCYYCSQGRKLPLIAKNKDKRGKKYDVYQGDCQGCPMRDVCTESKKGRIVHRSHNADWINKYQKRLTKHEVKEKIKERKAIVEHPYGTIKCMMGKIPLLLRGKQKVQIEIDLVTTAYNLKRLSALESMESLINRVQNYSWV